MGCDVRQKVVSRGWTPTRRGEKLCYSNPRGRKIFDFIPVLRAGAIVLCGHEESRPVFESHVTDEGGCQSFVLDGVGGRFIDHNGEGADALIEYLKRHMLLHTLTDKHNLDLLEERRPPGIEVRRPIDLEFKEKLLEALGPAVDLTVEDAGPPPEPARKSLLTDRMKEKLMAHNGDKDPRPHFKIFSPEGSGTWLLCSMEEDGDTLWAVCDIGHGFVEYGTVSLRELETTRGPRFKMHFERDIHFDGSKYDVSELLKKDSLIA